MPKHSVGFVYVVSNKAIPGMVKIGFTTKFAEERAEQLSSTSVPYPFDIEFRALTSHWRAVEKEAHDLLEPWRVNPRREFFAIEAVDAIETVRDALLAKAGIDAWQGDDQYQVAHEDRIALALMEGDLFLVVTYPDFMGSAEITDLWQAHNDGDVLDLMGTRDAHRVIGMGDEETGGEKDPIQHLDRDSKVPNGRINGRERLVPGERLIWLRAFANGAACKMVIFEMADHCQIVSRTWNSGFDSTGSPLLLNTVTYDKLPDGVIRTAQLVTRLPHPRSWSPKTPRVGQEWQPRIGGRPAEREYWLKQLRPTNKERRP
ncbi:GIY-YIG nuclease family protein [Streptosporangium sp. NPDC000396]|uniref:GIY-YIG nuclease family protein n=1 Tax=Streptosporangium sp. NPDC000396 TaxID=3366185 RepID=UPI0036A9AC1C